MDRKRERRIEIAMSKEVESFYNYYLNSEFDWRKELDEFKKWRCQEKLEAFSIIKEKMVNVYWLFACFEEGGLEKYNNYMDMLYLPECHLTQKEYDLLKDALKWK